MVLLFSYGAIVQFSYQIARALGFEPRSKVLETRMLPLHHARKNQLAN